ncbi:unnamed protein product [Blepharisma stoltei]|uniref:Uncharacterized protein n=1 Tax=Blepharisma stoltei TaxID=1481888 RepID=A0AAU9J9Q5_9CILI|nr:unnamed protein product [Blepharisma stoltei]
MSWLARTKKSILIIFSSLLFTSFFWVFIVYLEDNNWENHENTIILKDEPEERKKAENDSFSLTFKEFFDKSNQNESLPYDFSTIKSQKLSEEIIFYDEDIKSKPQHQGYTSEQSEIKFKYKNRSLSCPSEVRKIFSLENNKLTMNCFDSETPQYILGISPDEEIIGSVKFPTNWRVYTSPLDIGNTEFGFTKCSNLEKQAWLHNIFSEKISEKSLNKVIEIAKESRLSKKLRPQTVLVLLVDAVSRQHFYRSMKRTVSFMNENIVNGKFSQNHTVYDFANGNAHGTKTLTNLIPMLFGRSYLDHLSAINKLSLKNNGDEAKFKKVQEEIIWKHYEKYGFVTMLGWETKMDYLAEMIGRKILCDHVAASFWRGAASIEGFNDFSDKQRCIGHLHSHEYLLNYTEEFIKNYKGHNKFGYLHFLSGHEPTGSVIQTLDSHLATFLEEVLTFYDKNDEDLAIFLASDHGLHMGPWDRYEAGTVEIVTPFSFLITSKKLLLKLGPDTHDILLHNTQRLTGKYDIYLTLKHLALAPYGNIANQYQEWKSGININSAVSLFFERIPNNRTCENIGIPLHFCKSLKYQTIDLQKIHKLADHIAKESVITINKKIAKDRAKELCYDLSFKKVLDIKEETKESQNYSGKVYKVTFTINESEITIFNTIAYVGNSDKYLKENTEKEAYPQSEYENLQVQIKKIMRVDENDDYCIELASVIFTKGHFCICKYPKDFDINANLPAKIRSSLDKLKKTLSIIIGNSGQNCTQVCEENKKKCEKWGFWIVNEKEILNEPWRAQSTYQVLKDRRHVDFKNLHVNDVEKGELPGLINDQNIYKFVRNDSGNFSCGTYSDKIMPICPCTLHSFEY